MSDLNILMIGDIVGKNGRLVVNKLLPSIKKKYNIDFVIANGENATHGKGLIENHYEYLLNSGIDVITLGNHYNSKSEIADYINGAEYLIRPYNLKVDFPGVGTSIYEVNGYLIRVTNLLGCAFMSEEAVVQILKAINDFREENNKRWKQNEKRWEENDRRWEENDRRWKQNEEEHKQMKRARANDKEELKDILWKFQCSIEKMYENHEIRIRKMETKLKIS